MSKTKLNERKERRESRDLQMEKMAFIKRLQQEEDAEKRLREFRRVLDDHIDDWRNERDDTSDPSL